MAMQKKLQLINSVKKFLLLLNLKEHENDAQHFLIRKRIQKNIVLPFLLLLFSVTSYGQLATESFESGIPSSWTLFGNGVGSSTWGISPDGYLGSDAAFVNPSSENIGQGNIAQYFLVTPTVSVPANGEIRFYTKRATANANDNISYQIRLSTASQPDINGFTVVLQSWNGNDLNVGSETEYEEKIIAIPSSIPVGLDIYIAFVAVNTQTGAVASGDAWYIDNIRVIEGCLQTVAADVTFSQISPVSATVTWTHPNQTNFEIQYVEEGESPLASGEILNGNTITFDDLTGETTYDVYIRTICDSETSSEWAGPFSFTTAIYGLSCEYPIIINASEGNPYSLDSNLMNFPNAETITYSTHGSNCLPAAITQNYLGGNKIFLSFTADQDGLINLSQMTLPWSSGTQCWGNAISGVFIYENCGTIGIECLAGLNTTSTSQPKTIENFPVTAGTEYTIVISTSLGGVDTSICFEFDLSFTTCPSSSVYTYENLLQESVSFSWNNPVSIADSWEYVVLPVADPAPTGSGTPTATNENVLIDGLATGTTYNLYVRPICNETPGEWGAPNTFTTQCAVFDTPYNTGFIGASASNPEPCWTSLDANNDGVKWSYQGGWENGYLGYANLQTSTNQNFNHDYLVSPQINFDGVQKRLRFSQQVGWGGSSSYSIRISTSGIGVDNFTYVLLPETVISNESWQEVIYNIPTEVTGLVNIAWVVSPVGSGQAASRISFTNVFIEDKPICPDPIAPMLIEGSETTESAQFSWIVGDLENQWEVLVLPLNDPDPTSASTGLIVSDNPYTYGGLLPAKRYKFYVRAYCSDEHQSTWVGPVNFITECVTFDTPFYESFNDEDDNTQKFCWTINNANQDASQWLMEANNPEIRGSTSWFNPTTSYDDWLISPAINVEGVKELKYKYRARFSIFHPTSRYGIQVLISTTDTNPESFTELAPLEVFTNTDFIEKSIFFEASGTVYIAFRVPPDFDLTSGTSILDIDDVYIIDAPACPTPSALAATSILAETANLTWAPGFVEEAWQVVVQEAGLGTPTVEGETVSSTTYNANQLLPGTQYEFYVRAICTDSDSSEWAGPFVFTTLCSPFNTPFIETFNFDSTTENCWRILNSNDDGFEFVMNVTTNTYEGDQAAGMFTGSNGANSDWLVSPTINIIANQRLRFFYKVYDSFFEEDLQVKLSTTGINPEDFTIVLYDTEMDLNPLNNMEWKEMIINLPDGISGNINIGWHIPTMPPSPFGYRGQLLFIDSVIIEDIPACPAPYNMTILNINDTTIDVNWETAGTETQWEVVVQPFGTAAPGATSLPEYTHVANSHPFTVEGLLPAQKYEVYIRAICETESEWVGPVEVTTKCSFEDLCEYTVTLSGGPSSGIGGGIDVVQNGVVVQTLYFPTGAWNEEMQPVDFILFLCRGVEFSLFWDSIGTAPGQFPGATVEVKNSLGEIISTTDLGLLPAPRRTFFTGIATCGEITCPQPTNLTISEEGELSWTAGGSETSWEVFVQPFSNGTLPISGTIVTTNSYMPQASDFTAGNNTSYEYFVRAICSDDDTSYWSGPNAFVRNDAQSTAVTLTVNDSEICSVATKASFNGATPSADAMSCEGINGGDIWYAFQATSTTHLIDLDNFSGNHYDSSGDLPYGKITLTLYRVNGDNLEEIVCTYNNAIATMYSTELVIGETYKLRITQNETELSPYTFDICLKTIVDPCSFNVINGGFEQPVASIGLINNFISQNIVPGWRNNVFGYWSPGVFFYFDSLNTVGVVPYEGGQFIQMLASDTGLEPDLNNIDGMFQDFDSSEVTQYEFSFAHATRGGENSVDLFVGPPQGPFELVYQSTTTSLGFNVLEGIYNVPAGQDVTRFVFRSRNDGIGNIIDDVKITPNNRIISESQTLECGAGPVTVQANGVGNWEADENNPGLTTFADVNGGNATISGFSAPGEYVFHWRTRYCENSITVTYLGFDDVPTVTTPIEYCLNATAQPLTATATTGYTLKWYTEANGGTGSTTAPTPSTTALGSTSYYVVNVDTNGCEGPRVEIVVTIVDLTIPEVGFSYDATTYCVIGDNPVLSTNPGFVIGGTYTVNPSTGLSINAEGAINLSNSDAGTYEITYSVVQNGCVAANQSLFTITITDSTLAVVTLEYETPICLSGENPVPTDHSENGTFSSETLMVNSVTGEIDLSSATAGTHVITYTALTDVSMCLEGNSTSFTIQITEGEEVVISQECNGNALVLKVNENTSADYIWMDQNNNVVGSNEATFNVSEYLSDNPTATFPQTFTLTVISGECSSEGEFTVTSIPCVMIPKGISPNGDGKNDTLDLTGMGIQQITIFNRYGREVYNFNGNYSNQWHGQSNDGKELPSATYFYSVAKQDGSTATGWIYINR